MPWTNMGTDSITGDATILYASNLFYADGENRRQTTILEPL